MSSEMSFVIAFSFVLPVIGCQADSPQSDIKPEKVHFIRQVEPQTREWYEQQAGLWQAIAQQHPQDAEAWRNYYMATEYSYWQRSDAATEKRERLEQILSQMKSHVPDSYEYYLLAYRFNQDDLSVIEKAHALQPDNPEPYYDLIVAHKLRGNEAKATEFLRRLYASQDIAPALVDYDYNMLVSTDTNAVLFTNGDNDTYPAWMLQQAKSVRPDVLVLNVSLARTTDYLTNLLHANRIKFDAKELPVNTDRQFVARLCREIALKNPERPVYLALTIDSFHLQPLLDSLFIIGLAYRYSPERFDNLAVLRGNWERNFRLDNLRHDWYSENHISTPAIVHGLNRNYVTLIGMLMDHYLERGERRKFDESRALGRTIVGQAGNPPELIEFIEQR